MAGGGYVKLHRSIQDHPLWTREPASRAQAWMDLVMLAAWEPHRVIIGHRTVELVRGDVPASVRFMARRWRWGHKKTVAFIAWLEADQMLAKKRNGLGNGIPSVFSIVNYEIYQGGDDERGTDKGTPRGTVGERLGNKTKKVKKGKKETTTSGAVAVTLNGDGPEAVWGTPAALAALYNRSIPPGHPQVVRLAIGRLAKLTLALTQFPTREFWVGIFAEISQSSLLRGERPSPGHESFRADLDWLCSRGKDGIENALKVSEGKYRDAVSLEDFDR
ncbi:MAG TPA: hypothetical protein VGK54_10060 [Chloroflexota bacterium]|jgi:hypothetical protein